MVRFMDQDTFMRYIIYKWQYNGDIISFWCRWCFFAGARARLTACVTCFWWRWCGKAIVTKCPQPPEMGVVIWCYMHHNDYWVYLGCTTWCGTSFNHSMTQETANSQWSRFQGLRITLSNQALGDSGAHNTVPWYGQWWASRKTARCVEVICHVFMNLICVLYRSL